MYPFNRLSTVNAGDERVLVQQRRSLVPKSFMANILEMSLMTNGWRDEVLPKEEEPFLDHHPEGSPVRQGPTMLPFRNVRCFSRTISPVLQFLRAIAFFPGLFQQSNRRRKHCQDRMKYFALYTFAALIILLNCWLFKMNVWLMLFYQQQFGLMHTCTVSSIVSGIKPFVNAVVIALFIMHISAHYRLVNTVDTVDLCFRAAFHTTPPIRLYSLIFFFVSFAFFLGTFALFCVEFISFGSSLGTAADASFLIVPMLSLWNIVPLLYYDMYNRIVRWGKGFRMFKTN
ncbi:unnamed protein product, partial [Mesorhabditis spiculigera]